MFDGLFKPKFYTKCKSLVKITKTRVETVKRKKNSVCKYLKNDIVDLLKNSLDYNAYGRAEGLIEEKRRLSCYELLEQFCVCVGSNVSLLQKSSKCPEECREAISSLVYAAARVSEVPELRDLRSLFTDRYGSSLDHFVNPELVERFKAEPPSKEMKVELLQEMAREYSIKWDAKSLEQRLYTPRPQKPKGMQEEKPAENRSSLSFESLDDDNSKSTSRRSEDDSMSTSESCVSEDPETRPFYYRSIMPEPHSNKPKIEKQESLPDKIHIPMPDSPSSGRPKPRSVRRRLANPPPAPEEDGLGRMSRRTASWQPNPSTVPDFDEVAARVNALSRH